MNKVISKALITCNIIISLKIINIHNYLQNYEYISSKILDDNNWYLPNIFFPFFYRMNLYTLFITYHTSVLLEKFFGFYMYLFLLMYSFVFTNLLVYMISILMSDLLEMSNIYYYKFSGFLPILFCLRSIYLNLLNRDIDVFGKRINSKNCITLELLMYFLLNPSIDIFYCISGSLSGKIILKFINNITNNI